MSDAATSRPWAEERRIARLLEYWRAARPAPDLLPAREAIDPVQLGPDLLPFMVLVDATHGATRFRFRLVGTGLIQHAGLDLTGSYIDELNPNQAYADYVNGLYRMARDTRLPNYSETHYRAASGRVGVTQRILCPLASDGVTVDKFVGLQVFQTDNREGDAPTYTYAASFMPGLTRVIADAD